MRRHKCRRCTHERTPQRTLLDHDFARKLRVVFEERLFSSQVGCRRLHYTVRVGGARNQRMLARLELISGSHLASEVQKNCREKPAYHAILHDASAEEESLTL